MAAQERSSARRQPQPTTGNFALFKPPSVRPRPALCCHNHRATANPIGHLVHSSSICKKKKDPARVYLPPTVNKKKKNTTHPRKNAVLQSVKLHQRWKFAHWSRLQRRLSAVMRPVGCTAKFSWTRLMAAKLTFRSAGAVDSFCCSHIIWRSRELTSVALRRASFCAIWFEPLVRWIDWRKIIKL